MPPPVKVLLDAEVRLIVPVPVTARPDAPDQIVPLETRVHVPEPTAIVRVLELVELKLELPPLSVKL